MYFGKHTNLQLFSPLYLFSFYSEYFMVFQADVVVRNDTMEYGEPVDEWLSDIPKAHYSLFVFWPSRTRFI